mgnify:CR=1 FL=1
MKLTEFTIPSKFLHKYWLLLYYTIKYSQKENLWNTKIIHFKKKYCRYRSICEDGKTVDDNCRKDYIVIIYNITSTWLRNGAVYTKINDIHKIAESWTILCGFERL